MRAFRAFERHRLAALRPHGGRMVLLTDAGSTIIATQPRAQRLHRPQAQRSARHAQPADHSRSPSCRRVGADARRRIGHPVRDVRNLSAPLGQLAIIQRRAVVLAEWRADTTLAVTLFSATGFVVLMLGFAFLWQSTR